MLTINHKVSMLVAILTLSMICIISFSLYLGRDIARYYAPLADASMEIKLEATIAHLWFEEAISGDRTLKIEDFFEHIEKANWYAQAMLDGGQNQEGHFIALKNPKLRYQIKQTIKNLHAFKEIADRRWREQSQSGIGSDIDQLFDKTFLELIFSADTVETALQKVMARQLQAFTLWQALLIVAILTLGATTGMILYRHERRRINDLQILYDKEENLRITLNSIGDAVIATDASGNVTKMNPIAERLTGWKLEQARNKPLLEVFNIVNAHTMKPAVNPVKLVLETNKTVGLAKNTMLLSRNGAQYQIADSGAPIRSPDGNTIGVVLVFRDVTTEYALTESLRKSEEDARDLGVIIEQPLNEVYIFDATSLNFIHCNRGALKNIGYSLTELQKLTPLDIKPTMTAEYFETLIAPLEDHTEEKIVFETVHRHKNGGLYPVEVHLQLLSYRGKPAFAAIILDITARKAAEGKIYLLSRVFSDTHEGIIITAPDGAIVEVNPAFCEITGYSHEEVIGKNANILNSGAHELQFYTEMWQALTEQGHWQGEVWNRKKSGVIYAELLTISSLKDAEGNTLNYVGIFSDITYRKEQQEELEKMAHYDPLTQLPNRTLFYDRFLQAIAHNKRTKTLLAVCFLDLDNFKPVNDHYGHSIGDQLLIEVSARIKASIREEDTVSRQGGDEFTLLLGGLDSLFHCKQMLKRILNTLTKPYPLDGQMIRISASIGATLYPQDDSNIDTLIRHADHAMYQAKLAGKNCYHLFNAEHDQELIQKNQDLNKIRQALDNNEFCLYYQPKINMSTGVLFGMEALIRWQHPERGLIQPLEFLPFIKETELEIQVGEWVIQQALEQLCLWEQQGITLEVSINIASYHLQSGSFVQQLEKALLKQPTVNPGHLQLEILESSALGDTHTINSIIKSCQDALGVHVALDDFGTGYSSLTHLRNLPARIIKIDRSFVQDMLDDPDDYTIIDGIISLADSFDRQVIAEGVETTAHGLMLLLMGCKQAQGYGIARPMPADDIPEWINSYTPNEEWMACSHNKQSYNQKENKLQLLSLTLAQWQKKFETAIQSPADARPSWPIMDQEKCPCGKNWVKREKHSRLFNSSWLAEFDQAHKDMHFLAKSLQALYQDKGADAAIEGLPSFKIELEKMVALLQQES